MNNHLPLRVLLLRKEERFLFKIIFYIRVMRYIALSLILFFSIATTAQKRIVDEVDEFKGYRLQKTDLFNIHQGFGRLRARIIKQGESECLNLLWMFGPGDHTGIEKGAELIFKFEDGSTHTVYNHHTVHTSVGGASNGSIAGSSAQGMSFNVYLDTEDKAALLANKVVKLRVYLKSGHVHLMLKPRNDEMLKSALRAIE